MDTFLPLLAIVVAIGSVAAVYFFLKRPPLPPLSTTPVAPMPLPEPAPGTIRSVNEGQENPGGIPRPNLDDPKVAAADAAVRRWFGEKLGTLRGMSKPAAEKRIEGFVTAQNLTPGLAALYAYDQHCRERKLAPKRPPADIREAMVTLGLKR